MNTILTTATSHSGLGRDWRPSRDRLSPHGTQLQWVQPWTYMYCEAGWVLWASTHFCKGQGQTFLNTLTEVAEAHVDMARNKLQHCAHHGGGKSQTSIKWSTWWWRFWVDEEKWELTSVNLIFTVWCDPAGSHRREATPRRFQSADDGYGGEDHRTRHHPEYELWWRVHDLQAESE